jgi:hypothetical protein
MARLDRIVNVAISLNTTAIKEKSFSDLLVLGPSAHFATRTIVITGVSELQDMGFSVADPIYKAALSVFSQIPTINRLYIGRQLVASVAATVGAAVEGAEYSITVGWIDNTGTPQQFEAVVTAGVGDTPTDIATDLAAAIQGNAGAAAVVNAAAVGAVVTITPDVPGTSFSVATSANVTTPLPTSTELPSVALAAIQAETDDWYGVTMTTRVDDDVLDAANWVEANEKLLGVSASATAILNPGSTTDLAALLQQEQFFRTHLWYHADAANEWLDAAVAGNRFTFYPGGETWANVRLAGIKYDNLQEGQSLAVRNKNGNTFEPFRNFAITQNGKVAAGEWIDVIRFRDWLAEQIKINVVSALINADGKVPYTDPGIQIIVTAMRQALDLGVARGGIAPEEVDPDDNRVISSYVIEAPASANVPFNNKANRVLQDVNFTARLAGAIHTVEIKGSLTYAL